MKRGAPRETGHPTTSLEVRAGVAVAGLLGVLLMIFGLTEAAGVPLFRDPTPVLARSPWTAAGVTIGLLAADVLIPVPSSLVMYASGNLLGLWTGAFVSTFGSTLGFVIAYRLGRAGDPLIGHLLLPTERQRAERAARRWGMVAIVASRPIPILAEATGVIVGALQFPLGRALPASIIGVAPAAIAYAAAGAAATDSVHATLIFGAVLAASGLLWLAGKRVAAR